MVPPTCRSRDTGLLRSLARECVAAVFDMQRAVLESQMVQWTLADVSETHFVRSILLDMFSTRTHERICTTLELCFAARMLLGP